jgi:hypothetical protein
LRKRRFLSFLVVRSNSKAQVWSGRNLMRRRSRSCRRLLTLFASSSNRSTRSPYRWSRSQAFRASCRRRRRRSSKGLTPTGIGRIRARRLSTRTTHPRGSSLKTKSARTSKTTTTAAPDAADGVNPLPGRSSYNNNNNNNNNPEKQERRPGLSLLPTEAPKQAKIN